MNAQPHRWVEAPGAGSAVCFNCGLRKEFGSQPCKAEHLHYGTVTSEYDPFHEAPAKVSLPPVILGEST